MLVAAVILAQIPIHPEIVEEIIALEHAVRVGDPVHLLRHERAEHRRADLRMVERAQRVADVVEQRHHHIGLVPPVAMGAGRGLEGMFEPVDREPAEIALEQLEVSQHAGGQLLREIAEMTADDVPVLLGAVDHRGELSAVLMLGHGFSLLSSAGLLHPVRALPSFSPCGRRWPAGPDEGE